MAQPMMPGAPLTIALPKGRLAEDALAFLKKAGYAPRRRTATRAAS